VRRKCIIPQKQKRFALASEALVEMKKTEPTFLVRSNSRRINVHATTFAVEADSAVHEGEDGVVAAETDVLAGHELRAALADDDIAGDNRLAAEHFNAETLADAIASVLDGSLTFFMSHL
jgi:hypothetical protein